MGNSKKASIYKPKKGRRISQKKLYKMPQKGGGFLETFLGGNEDPKPESKEEEEDPYAEQDKFLNNPKPQPGDYGYESPEEEKEEETSNVPVEEKSEEETSNVPVEEKPEGEKSLLQTVGDSVKSTASELQTAFTGPSAEENKDSEEVTIDNMESTPEAEEVSKAETMESLQEKNQELLEENRKLSQQVIELQQAKIDSLTGTTPLGEDAKEEDSFATTEMNNDPSAMEGDMSVDNTGSAMEGDMSVDSPSAVEGDMSVDSPSAMEGDMSVDSPSAMEGDMSVDNSGSVTESDSMDVATPPTMEDETPLDTGSEYMEDTGAPVKPTEEDRKMGGTKRRKNKQRKTKRKRKGSKK